jgi:hypothetical protein
MSNIFCFVTHLSKCSLTASSHPFLPSPSVAFSATSCSCFLHPASCLVITRLLFRLLQIHFLNLKAFLSVKQSYLFHPFPFRLLNLSLSPLADNGQATIDFLVLFSGQYQSAFLRAVRSAWHLVITDFFSLAYYSSLKTEPIRSSESSVNFTELYCVKTQKIVLFIFRFCVSQ